MAAPLAYWHSSGGDVVAAGGQVVADADARALRALHLDETRAAASARPGRLHRGA